MLTDNEFIKQFEQKTLNQEEFDHVGHLKIAWLYLTQYDLETAVTKVTSGISSYASSLGASDKFQHTLTEAIVYIMASKINSSTEEDFASFLHNNPELVDSLPRILSEHYSVDRLISDDARVRFVEPDIKPFNNVN